MADNAKDAAGEGSSETSPEASSDAAGIAGDIDTGETAAEGEPEHELESEPEPEPESEPEPEPEPRPAGSRTRGRVVLAVSVFGELLITAGVILALFVVYSLWWTNVVANREADRKSDRVRDNWAADRGPEGPGARDLKDGIGFLHAPSMTDDDVLVTKGTNTEELNHGIAGYYTKPVKSALPWDQSGNFALAAHRDGHGAKFHDIDKIAKGDPVVFETKNTWYVYKVYEILPKTSKYNVDVLDPVPKESGRKEDSRYITLTTCTPVFTSKHRYVVWGELVRTETVDEDRTPPKEIR